MSGVFYHSVILGLGLFICFILYISPSNTIKHVFFYVLHYVFSMSYTLIKVFDQSEGAQGPINITMFNNTSLAMKMCSECPVLWFNFTLDTILYFPLFY